MKKAAAFFAKDGDPVTVLGLIAAKRGEHSGQDDGGVLGVGRSDYHGWA